MRVRIHFRGLVLFRFPAKGVNGDLTVELISDPKRKETPGKPHEHRAEIQAVTAQGVRSLAPQGLADGTNVHISMGGESRVSRSDSFEAYVPRLSDLVARGTTDEIRSLKKGDRRPEYVRNTITVNRGQVRVKDVVIWDAGGFPLSPTTAPGVLTSVPTELKFMGSAVKGHTANECVIDVPDVNKLTITSNQPNLKKEEFDATDHAPKHKGGYDAIEILITNYEPQREKPTPWGMDFQWLFAAAGYSMAPLPESEFKDFSDFAKVYHSDLFREDVEQLMEGTLGRPFPYVSRESLFTALSPINPKPVSSTTNDIDSRPVCVPGDDD